MYFPLINFKLNFLPLEAIYVVFIKIEVLFVISNQNYHQQAVTEGKRFSSTSTLAFKNKHSECHSLE